MKINHYKSLLTYVCSLCFLAGCATIDPASYSNQTPQFVLEEFFDGNVNVWGIVQNRSGNVVQRFNVDIAGNLEGNTLTLDETFNYRFGAGVDKRVWVIERHADGTYTGMADDILPGATGRSYGNAFKWTYEMNLPVNDKSYRVRFNDWIWAFDDNTIMNRAYIRKFGLTFAEVTLFMQRAQ